MVWIKDSQCWAKMVCGLLAGSMTILAQEASPDTFHITEPALPNPGGNGWNVDPRLGQLAVTIPIGVMPGEISFPVSLTMNATTTTRSKRVLLGYSGAHDNLPVYGVSSNTTPISCGVNLGAISPTPGGMKITLENGRSYSSSDFEKTGTKFSALNGISIPLLGAYGFSQPGSGLLPGPISADGSLLLWSSYPMYFPSQHRALLESLFSAAYGIFGTCGSKQMNQTNGSGYTVLMDRDRARVFARIEYKVPDTQECTGSGDNKMCETIPGDSGSIYLPIFIMDRFGHYVTMRWSASGSLRRVDVLNQRGQGFTVRMHNRSTELARLDFINFSGPSALILGSGPSPFWLNQDPAALNPKPVPKTTWGPESIGYPTTVTIGNPENVLQPSWSGTLGAASNPPSTLASGNSLSNRVWSLAYDGDRGALASIMEPAGVVSNFKTQAYGVMQTANWFESTEEVSTISDSVTGVNQVDQADQSGRSSASRRFTWERQVSTYAISVTQKDYWDPSSNQADRYARYQYGDSSNVNSAINNPTDRGNGFLNYWTLFGGTQEWARVDRASTTTKSNPVYSTGRGLNGYLSLLRSTVKSRLGEAAQYQLHGYLDESTGLQPSKIEFHIGPNGTASWTKVHEQSYAYNTLWGMLETQQINRSVSARFIPAGVQPATDVTTHEWDTSNLLQLQKTYRNNGGLQHGSAFSYDAHGRLATQSIYHSENGTLVTSPNTLTMAYDDAVTGLPTTWTTTYQDGADLISLTKTQGEFDDGHRPQLSTDERAVNIYTTFDLYGRPKSTKKDGEAEIKITYLDEWTKVTTQAGKTTTEHFDGFGRLIKTELPDGRIVVPTYDLHSRVVATTEASKGNTATRIGRTEYDLLDRVTAQISVTGKRTEFAYSTDGINNIVTQIVDPQGLRLITITKTDPFGQVVSVTAPNGDLTSYTYDGHGNKTSVTVTPAGGGTPQIRTFQYDLLGRLIQKTEPETGTQIFSNFNALNQAQTLKEIGVIPANGSRTRTLAYDGLGRLRSQSGGGGAETFIYQGAFLTKSTRTVGDDVVTQTFAYKGSGARLSQESTTHQIIGQ